jgi:hypothetical protein
MPGARAGHEINPKDRFITMQNQRFVCHNLAVSYGFRRLQPMPEIDTVEIDPKK